MHILLISDIHANFPALEAIDVFFRKVSFDLVINCGDSLVYAPFPNETLLWLQDKRAVSILGNTDKKVIKLTKGKTFKKPAKPEKRCMYTWTADALSDDSKTYLFSLKNRAKLSLNASWLSGTDADTRLGIYHGSPAKNHEFLFSSTPDERFAELAQQCNDSIVVCGHSHDPFHKCIDNIHFINPGSAGRMFDGNPDASCAVLQLTPSKLHVCHHRIPYDVTKTIQAINNAGLPKIYCEMFRLGIKSN